MSEHLETTLYQDCYLYQGVSKLYYKRTEQARENWILGTQSRGSFLHNSDRAAEASRSARIALFELIDMRF